MAKTLTFKNISGTVRVDYVTDMISNDHKRFTVSEVKGASDAEIRAGLQFRQLAYHLDEFIAFAQDNNLKLEISDLDSKEVLVDFDASFSSSFSI